MIDETQLIGKSKTEILKLFGSPTKGAITNVWTYNTTVNNIEKEITIYFDPENGQVILFDNIQL
ncbi:hypothetical protein [Cellulophaga omnivescoria]|uniref:hypothetical protein n=1 Tax=Cellulophaga omnivescoria TaxID=1888890 RepID=UPI000986CB82|nr:hypothetical protein [Cellulophaga omnivescoria]WBU88499.1 hypothetical protein PBN93_11520 [Cellulophaga omnivescoria]WKB80478.1 hypothetical protein QYR09_12030 [Cellulophaga lytica]